MQGGSKTGILFKFDGGGGTKIIQVWGEEGLIYFNLGGSEGISWPIFYLGEGRLDVNLGKRSVPIYFNWLGKGGKE